MHESVMMFVAQHVTPRMVAGKHVLEIGSYNVNGSVRPLIEALKPASYLATDMRPGPGVDFVFNIARTDIFETSALEPADLIICCEVLEHVKDWRLAIDNMKRLLKPDGWLILTTRSIGFPLHEYPGDYWRFSKVDMGRIFADMTDLEVLLDPQVPGVFVEARGWDAEKPVELSTIDVYAMPGGA